jgi:hypothetical protein
MTCYICLEQGEMMNMGGCSCKGTVTVHKKCFEEWMSKSDNPFKCSVCKADFNGTFMTNFMTEENILMFNNNPEKYDENGDEIEEIDDDIDIVLHNYSGMEYLELNDGELLFTTNKHAQIYYNLIKLDKIYKKNEYKICQKNMKRDMKKNTKFISKSKFKMQKMQRKIKN